MAWLVDILNGANAVSVLIFLALIVGVVYLAFRSGKISYSGHGLRIGKTRESELRIVREQLQYMHGMIDGTFRKLPDELQSADNYYKCKYWFSILADLLESIIIYNHITPDSTYVQLKQETAYNEMLANVDNNPYWKSPEFRGLIYNLVSELIPNLVKVRETYETTK